MVALAIAACAGCSRRASIASCDDDLRGVYVADGERWMMLDHGSTLEAYPLFPDGTAREPERSSPVPDAGSALAGGTSQDSAALVVAPRVIDLERTQAGAPGSERTSGAVLSGTLHRRYMRRAKRCDAQVPVHVTRCAGETLDLVLADPSPPLSFSPCLWPAPGASRVVRWRRE